MFVPISTHHFQPPLVGYLAPLKQRVVTILQGLKHPYPPPPNTQTVENHWPCGDGRDLMCSFPSFLTSEVLGGSSVGHPAPCSGHPPQCKGVARGRQIIRHPPPPLSRQR